MQVKRFLLSVKEYFDVKKSYSQDGEDIALAAFYDTQKGYKGFFVDVGAHHPKRFSNTYHFYKRGWRGINIDAMPGSMKGFKVLRSGDINLEVGVGKEVSKLHFYCFNDPALNSFDRALSNERDAAPDRYKIKKVVEIDVLPLRAILHKQLPKGQKIDFMSVDVEGFDLDVLRSNDWNTYRPTYLLIEDLNYSIMRASESPTVQYLKQIGYTPCASLRRTIIFKTDH
jgi:FkbM family methyltransferase